jgi:hypothetical protein
MMTADELIRKLNLAPHPEGGAFRETYRSVIASSVEGRSVCTGIYFLLKRGEISAWHRVCHDEMYHFYYGSPLRLRCISLDGVYEERTLGVDWDGGQQPQLLIPGNWWQSAESLGDFTLIGCTVSPGFDFRDFEMATPEILIQNYPHLRNRLI